MLQSESRTPVRVLEVLDPPDTTTRYVDQVVTFLPAWVHVDYFTWRRALTTRYDVLHVHWPERVLRGRGVAGTWLNRLAFVVLMLRCWLLRVAIVRTEHNLRPHESGSAVESALMSWLRRSTDVVVRLNDATPVDPGRADVLVRHGDYRTVFAPHPRSARVPGRLLYFGLIRPYKGVERLLEVVRGIDDPALTLRVVGRPVDEQWRARVEAAVAEDPRISATLEFVPDDRLVAEVTAAELVVLPFTEMHNSGTVLVALSLDRPVLAPRSEANEVLLREVGDRWLHLYDGELTAEVVQAARAAAVELAPDAVAGLEGRDWPTVGRLHAQVFAQAVAAAGRHGRPGEP